MSTILDKLHADHVRMAKLLDLLDEQLDLLRHPQAEASASYALVRDIARYFVTFPERVHHAVEDRVFGALQDAAPELTALFTELRNEHAALGALGQRFLAVTEQVCAGQVVEREALVLATAEFLELQRKHMNTEERDIFPLARERLNEVDIAAIEADYAGAVDPVFGPRVADYFERLHGAIVERA